MNREKITKIVVFLIEGSLLLLIFFLPLYFSFFYKTISSFLVNVAIDRTAVFKSLVGLLFFLTLLRIMLEGELTMRVSKKQLLAVSAVLFSAIAATIFSVDWHTSFWGSDTRQQGLITAVYCFLFFLIVMINIRDRRQVERLLTAAILSGSVAAGFGLLQALGYDLLFRKPTLAPISNRVGSTLGHPVFLGNFLLLVLSLSCYKFVAVIKNRKKAFYLSLAVLQLIVLFLTQSRGAWLGLLVGIVSAALLYAYYFRRNFVLPILLSLVILATAVAGLLYFKAGSLDTVAEYKSTAYSFTARVKSILDLKSGSVALRLKYWPSAVKSIMARPVFGYGLDAQYLPLFEAYDPSWMIYEAVNSKADRAHNEFLDISLSSGIFGLLAYLFLLGVFIKSACVRFGRSQGPDLWLFFFLLAGLFAYHGALLFNFSTIETKTYFWLYLGVLAALLSDFKPAISLKTTDLRPAYRLASGYAVVMVAIIFPLLILSNINEVEADYGYQQAKFAERNRSYVPMINNYLEAIHLNAHDESYRADFAVALINAGITGTSGTDQASTSLLEYLDEQLKFDSGLQDNYFRSLTRAVVFSIYGRYRDPSYYQRAEEIYRRLEKVNPAYLNLHKNWALLYIQQGKFKEAIERDQKLFTYLPDLNDRYLNDEHRAQIGLYLSDVYSDIAYAQTGLGLVDEAIATNLFALKFNPFNPRVYKKISQLYLSQGKPDEAIAYARHGLALAPSDQEMYKLLIYIFKKKGDFDSARYYLDRAKEQPADVKTPEAMIN
jgi:putative inorganic carbon (HCO3(-)) transporter